MQRIFVLSLALGAGIAAIVGWWVGWPVLGISVALFLLLAYALALAVEFALLWRIESPEFRPEIGALIAAWWDEAVMTPSVFCWRQPFRSTAVPDHLPHMPNGGHGVLFVHGLACNRGFWNPWLRRLASQGRTCLAVNLEPAFGAIGDAYADTIGRAVQRLEQATGAKPVIVAHSMGGLAVRYWMQRDMAAHRVERVITIGTPHRGTWLARFGRTDSARQMAIDSDWLRCLAARESAATYSRFTCFYGRCDNVVFPSSHAQLPGADNRLIERTAHVVLAFTEETFAETMRWLGPAANQYTRSVDKRSDASSSPSAETR